MSDAYSTRKKREEKEKMTTAKMLRFFSFSYNIVKKIAYNIEKNITCKSKENKKRNGQNTIK